MSVTYPAWKSNYLDQLSRQWNGRSSLSDCPICECLLCVLHILPLTEGEKLFWFSRTQNSLLLPFDQLNQPRNAWTNIIDPSAGHLSYATQAQLQPSAPPSPTFTPSTPATSMPSGVIPQDPRLPSLYLPSYDEAVNMQQWTFCSGRFFFFFSGRSNIKFKSGFALSVTLTEPSQRP